MCNDVLLFYFALFRCFSDTIVLMLSIKPTIYFLYFLYVTTGSEEPTHRTFIERRHTSPSIWGEAGQKVYDNLPITQPHATGLHQWDWNWTSH